LTGGYRQNKSPFAIALGDWFLLRRYVLTNKASPNDSKIVIVIIIGEARIIWHGGAIIAQTVDLDRVFREEMISYWQGSALLYLHYIFVKPDDRGNIYHGWTS
jgi:hypothetical protein